MRIERSPSNTWLWLVMIFLPLLMAQSVQAQVKHNQPTAINSEESFKTTADSSTNTYQYRQPHTTSCPFFQMR
ncbi:hypothetical protein [Nostoc sp. PA-18-2419]|uniref:hypothetical protein n=1 Tax=Nostoc sp. PA-18-2419 TaxID=2575443 RepID=UPI001109E273|nr:hypothetical protein [Nostoc sp. PA-18-2419]